MKKMNILLGVLSIALISLLAAIAANAQDSRDVTQPVLPPVCEVLKAQLSSNAGGLPAADETKLDTRRIQQAIDSCTKGHGVELASQGENNAFLTGPLQLREGVTLIVAKGVTLYASRDAALYDRTPGSCGVMRRQLETGFSDPIGVHEQESESGCKPLILADHVSNAGVMGDGIIDGRGGARILGKDHTWWDLGLIAKKESRQGVPTKRFCPRLIEAYHANNFTLYRITLKNAPQFNVTYDDGDGFTVWGIKIDTPMFVAGKHTALNTDGIDPGNGAKNITITHSYIRDGDDNIAFTGGLTNATVSYDHFYWGHGMSIGSVVTKAGVSKIRVYDLTIDGAENGIRIKSSPTRGGLVHDVVYDDVCIRNSLHPITFYMDYPQDAGVPLYPEYGKSTLPTYHDITLADVRVSGGGKILFQGYSHKYGIEVGLNGVLLTDANTAKYTYSIQHADFHLGPGPVNLQLNGTDTTTSGKANNGSLASCADKFVPFPQQ